MVVISRRQRFSSLLLAGKAECRTTLRILLASLGMGFVLVVLVVCLVWAVYWVTPIWFVLSSSLLSLEKQHAAVDSEYFICRVIVWRDMFRGLRLSRTRVVFLMTLRCWCRFPSAVGDLAGLSIEILISA